MVNGKKKAGCRSELCWMLAAGVPGIPAIDKDLLKKKKKKRGDPLFSPASFFCCAPLCHVHAGPCAAAGHGHGSSGIRGLVCQHALYSATSDCCD